MTEPQYIVRLRGEKYADTTVCDSKREAVKEAIKEAKEYPGKTTDVLLVVASCKIPLGSPTWDFADPNGGFSSEMVLDALQEEGKE